MNDVFYKTESEIQISDQKCVFCGINVNQRYYSNKEEGKFRVLRCPKCSNWWISK